MVRETDADVALRDDVPREGGSGAAQPPARTSRLYSGHDLENGEILQVGGCQVGVFTRRCPGKETGNEDAAGVIEVDDQSGILVVADGMGGSAAGEQAAQLAVQTLQRVAADHPVSPETDTLLRTTVLNGVERANQKICELGIGAATTLAAVAFRGPRIRPFHVGDSMILVVGGRGKVKLQTVSHSPVGYGVEAGLLDEDEAMHHEDRHLISNYVGSEQMRIEIGPETRLRPRDTVLLASDGLFDNLHLEEIVETIRKGPLSKVLRKLVDQATQRMVAPKANLPSKPDDLTFVVLRQSSR